MSEMIDRVALAIAAASLDDDELPVSAELLDVVYKLFARAAIKAMRDPTDEMVGFAWECTDRLLGDDLYIVAWRAMIDEALGLPVKEGVAP